MSVAARVLLSATVSFFVIAFCAFQMWRNLALLEKTQGWVAHTNKVIAHTNEALAALVDMETGSRGFAVGGKEEFLQPYEAGKVAFAGAIETSKKLVADNPTQVGRFQKLSDDAQAWINGPVQQDIEGRRAVMAGTLSEDNYRTTFNQANGKRLMDQMRKQVAEVIGAEETLLVQRDKDYQDAVADSRIWGSWVIAAAIAFGWAILFYISRGTQRVLVGVASTLNEASAQVSGAAKELASSSQTLASGASEQAASLEETSASLEEVGSMTKRNALNAESARQLSGQARHTAEVGVAGMQAMARSTEGIRQASADMRQTMDGIKSASADVSKIIKTIDEIAFQTNLLALNAAVEAARAGEAGMGFAVVADEVRNLAQRSAKAAKETADMIEASIKRSDEGAKVTEKVVAAVEDVAAKARDVEKHLSEILSKSQQVDEQVAQIATASNEQSQGISQVSIAVTQMDKVTQSNASNAEESAAGAEELNAQAATLRSAVAELEKLVGREASDSSITAHGSIVSRIATKAA